MASESIDGIGELLQGVFGREDGPRRVLEFLLERAMRAEVEAHLGACRHERSGGRTGYRNGTKPRALRTRVVHADNGTPVHVLLVTSPGRGEGKSVTAANLALTMAQEYQQRICVVDANLRHPQLHRLFDISEAPGLADVLLGRASLEDSLVAIEDHHITALPAGDPAAHPAELLGTVAMRRLLESLRSQFDRIVIDAPAAAPLADIGILTPLVDSVMLVVRAGITSKPAIQDAVAAVDHGKLLGVVLNEAL